MSLSVSEFSNSILFHSILTLFKGGIGQGRDATSLYGLLNKDLQLSLHGEKISCDETRL